MPLYSIIVEYAGGTHVSQKQADDRDAALRLWLDDTSPESASAPFIHRNKPKRGEKLTKRLLHPDFGPHRLTGCANLWQSLFRLHGKNSVMHIIRTDTEEEMDTVTGTNTDPPSACAATETN